ncbi:MAG: S24 family peptidase [Acidobacteriaceae bacterium]
MKFSNLKDNLRRAVLRKIEAGEITGQRLAQLTGFQQAHISNFLNRKRSLSLEGLDKVLSVEKMSILDLLDPNEINKRASIVPPTEGDFESVLLVDSPVAATSDLVTNEQVKDILKFKKAFLKRLRADSSKAAQARHRFVLIKLDAHEGMSMFPRTLPGATLLIDRHYTSLKPYRGSEQNMYAVNVEGKCAIKYVEFDGTHLVLRPHNSAYPINVLQVEEGKAPADYIVGRVCHIAIES